MSQDSSACTLSTCTNTNTGLQTFDTFEVEPFFFMHFLNYCLIPTYYLATGKDLNTGLEPPTSGLTAITDPVSMTKLSDILSKGSSLDKAVPLIYNNLTFTSSPDPSDPDPSDDCDIAAIQWYLTEYNNTLGTPQKMEPLPTTLLPCITKAFGQNIATNFSARKKTKYSPPGAAKDATSVWQNYSIRHRTGMSPLKRLPILGTDKYYKPYLPAFTDTMFLAGNSFNYDTTVKLHSSTPPPALVKLTGVGNELTYLAPSKTTILKNLLLPNNKIGPDSFPSEFFSQQVDFLNNSPSATPYNLSIQALHIGNGGHINNKQSTCLNNFTVNSTLFAPSSVSTITSPCCLALQKLNVSGLSLDGESLAALTLPPNATNLQSFTAIDCTNSTQLTLNNTSTKCASFSYIIKGDDTNISMISETGKKTYPYIDMPNNSLGDTTLQAFISNIITKDSIYIDLSRKIQNKNPSPIKVPSVTCKDLTYCNLTNCFIDSVTLTGLTCDALACLNLANCGITSFNASFTSATLLTSLKMPGNPFTKDFTLKAPALTELDISYTTTPTTKAGTDDFGKLTTLNLDLSSLPLLKTLAARNHIITNFSLTGVSPALTDLDLSFNKLLSSGSTIKFDSGLPITNLKLNGNTKAKELLTSDLTFITPLTKLKCLYLFGMSYSGTEKALYQNLLKALMKSTIIQTNGLTIYFFSINIVKLQNSLNQLTNKLKWAGTFNICSCLSECFFPAETSYCSTLGPGKAAASPELTALKNCYKNPIPSS